MRAYCLLWLERNAEAAAALDDAIELWRNFRFDWEFERLTELTELRRVLGRSPAEAREQLEAWARQTALALKLEG
jgi:hypothetical protein